MAEDLYRQAVEQIRPFFHLSDMGHAEASTTELREGIAKLESVVTLAPGHWPSYWVMGKAYEALGQPAEEYACFRKAFELQRENPDVAREYMRTCLALGKGLEAVEVASHACKMKPDDAGLMANLGLALLVAGDFESAMNVTQAALDLSPDDEVTRSLLEAIRDVKEGRTPQPTRWPDNEEVA